MFVIIFLVVSLMVPVQLGRHLWRCNLYDFGLQLFAPIENVFHLLHDKLYCFSCRNSNLLFLMVSIQI